MKNRQPIDIIELFTKIYGEDINRYIMPPPIIETMKCEIIEYDEQAQSLVSKMPILLEWCNPFSTMQGGMIMAAVDNAVGPLSMLVSTPSWTRNMESKFLKPIGLDLDYIYVTASVSEQKRGRIIFDVTVADESDTVYAECKVTNWLMKEKIKREK